MGVKYTRDLAELNKLFPDYPDVYIGPFYSNVKPIRAYIAYNDDDKTLAYDHSNHSDHGYTKDTMDAFLADIIERVTKLSETIKDHKVKIKNFQKNTKITEQNIAYDLFNFNIILKDDDRKKYKLKCEVQNYDHNAMSYGIVMTVSFEYLQYQIEMNYVQK